MMFIISKLFTYLCLPPGIFIIILILAGFLAKKFKWLFFASGVLLYLISIKPVANALLKPLESFNKTEKISPKAVVVLGGGVNPKDILHAMPDAFKREVYGILISKENNLPFIFTGGGLNKEAKWIKKDVKFITSVCGCKIKTLYETKSLDTYENAKFTAELFNKKGIPKEIYLITSAYHMKRSYYLFKHFGFKIITKPIGFFSSPVISVWDFFPGEGSFHKSYKAIHEYFGILSLYLRGVI